MGDRKGDEDEGFVVGILAETIQDPHQGRVPLEESLTNGLELVDLVDVFGGDTLNVVQFGRRHLVSLPVVDVVARVTKGLADEIELVVEHPRVLVDLMRVRLGA